MIWRQLTGRDCYLARTALSSLLLLTGVAGASQSRDSADTLKKLSLEELSRIEVITVAKEPRRAFQTPAAIYVLTSDDIRHSGATNIPDLLRLVPGVHVAQIDSAKWAIGIRGFQGYLSKSVLVLIDGRSVYTPMFAGTYWEMQDTLLEDIERIEVIRGPGATIWGANAVNGVINIITRSARDTRGMLVSTGGGTVEQGFLNWRYGGGSDRIAYRIYGRGATRGPQRHSDGRNFDDWRIAQTGFRADWTATPRDSLTIQGDAYATETGTALNLTTLTPPSLLFRQGNAGFSGQNLIATWQRAIDSRSSLQLRAYYDRTDRQDLHYREVRHTLDADFVYHRTVGRHTLSTGGGARTSPARFFQVSQGVRFHPERQTYNIFSTFLEDEIALVRDRLFLTAGSKFQHNTFSGFEFQPTVRFAYSPNLRRTLWGGVTRAVRTPSWIEAGFDFNFLVQPAVPLFLRLIGDGNFDSEKLYGYELGYRQRAGPNLVFALTGYFNRYDDLASVESRPIFAEPEGAPQRAILPLDFRNGLEAQASGTEVNALWDVSAWLRLRGFYSLSLLDARRQPGSIDASTVGQLEGDTPQHRGLVQAMFQLPANLELDLAYRHVSGVPNQGVTAYQTGDVRLAWRFQRQFELSVVGRNLLQPAHVEYGENPGPLVGIRRSAFARLTWISEP